MLKTLAYFSFYILIPVVFGKDNSKSTGGQSLNWGITWNYYDTKYNLHNKIAAAVLVTLLETEPNCDEQFKKLNALHPFESQDRKARRPLDRPALSYFAP